MTKYPLLMLLTAFIFLEVGCREIPQQSIPADNTEKPVFIKENGTLKVKEGGKSCVLAENAIDYEVYVSPDAAMIAVETLLMSDLQIVRVYKKDPDGCFRPLKQALSTKLWHDLSKEEGFSIDEISHPRMKFLKWIGKEQIYIELSGELEKRVVDRNVSCDLQAL